MLAGRVAWAVLRGPLRSSGPGVRLIGGPLRSSGPGVQLIGGPLRSSGPGVQLIGGPLRSSGPGVRLIGGPLHSVRPRCAADRRAAAWINPKGPDHFGRKSLANFYTHTCLREIFFTPPKGE